ncbi:hypothetical protein [Endozoicomonas lisbonensis]|uniref:Uncharacterized protein n=1 Tax=Endozoicomonas lisbonensis TaxID=3120522 RepID=A0ABV2SI01_9GAMM
MNKEDLLKIGYKRLRLYNYAESIRLHGVEVADNKRKHEAMKHRIEQNMLANRPNAPGDDPLHIPNLRQIYKHIGVGIVLLWLKHSQLYQDDDSTWAALSSRSVVKKAYEIDQDFAGRINAHYGLDTYSTKSATYDVNLVCAVISEVCTRYGLGFQLRLPKQVQIVPIKDIEKLINRSSDFIGIILRLSPLSISTGAIGVRKEQGEVRLFVHEFGECRLDTGLLSYFFNTLSEVERGMNYTNACLFKSDFIDVASGEGTSGSTRRAFGSLSRSRSSRR